MHSICLLVSTRNIQHKSTKYIAMSSDNIDIKRFNALCIFNIENNYPFALNIRKKLSWNDITGILKVRYSRV